MHSDIRYIATATLSCSVIACFVLKIICVRDQCSFEIISFLFWYWPAALLLLGLIVRFVFVFNTNPLRIIIITLRLWMCESASRAWRMRTHVCLCPTNVSLCVWLCLYVVVYDLLCGEQFAPHIFVFLKSPILTAIRNFACAPKGESSWIHSKCAAHTYICREAFVATVRFWFAFSFIFVYSLCFCCDLLSLLLWPFRKFE